MSDKEENRQIRDSRSGEIVKSLVEISSETPPEKELYSD